jgi:hypothetical protein
VRILYKKAKVAAKGKKDTTAAAATADPEETGEEVDVL